MLEVATVRSLTLGWQVAQSVCGDKRTCGILCPWRWRSIASSAAAAAPRARAAAERRPALRTSSSTSATRWPLPASGSALLDERTPARGVARESELRTRPHLDRNTDTAVTAAASLSESRRLWLGHGGAGGGSATAAAVAVTAAGAALGAAAARGAVRGTARTAEAGASETRVAAAARDTAETAADVGGEADARRKADVRAAILRRTAGVGDSPDGSDGSGQGMWSCLLLASRPGLQGAGWRRGDWGSYALSGSSVTTGAGGVVEPRSLSRSRA